MPLRLLKARRHLNYVRVGQQKGEGRREGWGKQPPAGTAGPLRRPESRGNTHPGSEQERKRHCADRGESFPNPLGGERTRLVFPWASQGEPVSRERGVSARKGKYCCSSLKFSTKILKAMTRPSQERLEAGKEGREIP